MTTRIQTTGPTVQAIQPSEAGLARLDPTVVAEALGGEPCAEHIEGPVGPLTLDAY